MYLKPFVWKLWLYLLILFNYTHAKPNVVDSIEIQTTNGDRPHDFVTYLFGSSNDQQWN